MSTVDLTATWLRSDGYIILDQWYEHIIPIIAYDRVGDILHFVDVYRRDTTSTRNEIFVRYCKQWLKENHWEGQFQYDLVTMGIKKHQNVGVFSK